MQPKTVPFFWGPRFAGVFAPRVSCRFQGTAAFVLNLFPFILGPTFKAGNPVARWMAGDGFGGSANCVDPVFGSGSLGGEIADPRLLSNVGVVPAITRGTNFRALAENGGRP